MSPAQVCEWVIKVCNHTPLYYYRDRICACAIQPANVFTPHLQQIQNTFILFSIMFVCKLCNVSRFSNPSELLDHILGVLNTYEFNKCLFCDAIYPSNQFIQHLQDCNISAGIDDDFVIENLNLPETFNCKKCNENFGSFEEYEAHQNVCNNAPLLQMNLDSATTFVQNQTAFRCLLRLYCLERHTYNDVDLLFESERENMFLLLNQLLDDLCMVKIKFCAIIEFQKPSGEETTAYLCSLPWYLVNMDEFDEFISNVRNDIVSRIDQFTERGSGWIIKKIRSLNVHVGKYVPHRGGCNLHHLPTQLKNKRCIMNFNCERDCFMYSVLAALHPTPTNPQRSLNYERFQSLYKFSDVRDSVDITDIRAFEKSNAEISINVFSVCLNDKSVIIPLKLLHKRRSIM